MQKYYKRKASAILIALILIIACLFGCSSPIPPKTNEELKPPSEIYTPTTDGEEEGESPKFEGLSVHYLDVGQGDCILICLPDDKSMMIDCGNGSASSVETVVEALKAKQISNLDYLIITHPDKDHIGSIKQAFKDVGVKKVYHPDVSESKTGFEEYFETLQFLADKGAQFEISLQGECIAAGEYKIAILAPKERRQRGSSYADFHLAIEPNESQINNLSSFVYLEYKEYRFLFTGDADKKAEEKLLEDYNAGFLKKTFSDKNINLKLEDVDFLKVSHHGSEDSSGVEFLSLVKPKNAIISVGGDNIYGHPATSTQKRLIEANEDLNILRTDVKGTVSVFINSLGEMAITTQSEKN